MRISGRFDIYRGMKNTNSTPVQAERYGQAGYPTVEKLIDTEDFDAINLAFEEAYGELFEMSKKKKSFGTQRDIKRMMRSLELTLDLFRELLAIKYRLQDEMAKAKKKP